MPHKERLVVKNFSVLQHVDVEINRINILIGEQATGKSLLAKLVCFFKAEISTRLTETIQENKSFEQYVATLQNRFHEYFYRAYLGKEFEIQYFYQQSHIKISSSKNSTLVELSDDVETFFNQQTEFWKNIEKKDNQSNYKLLKTIELYFFGFFALGYVAPASRTFFSLLEKNFYTLYNKINIDPTMLNFGERLEKIKENWKPANEKLESAQKHILKGNINVNDQNEWAIQQPHGNIRLKFGSSGQQETLPLLAVLQESFQDKNAIFDYIIEEPEVHLFPTAQKKLVEAFAMSYNFSHRCNTFFITTHSPYILTSFNCLIQAENTYRAIQKRLKDADINQQQADEKLQQLDAVLSPDKRVAFEDVSFYVVENGILRDAKHYENQLLDADAIDEASNAINNEFDTLLNIEYD